MDGKSLFIYEEVKLSKQQINFFQLIAGSVLVFIGSLLSADLPLIGLSLWFGGLWIALAWKLGLSPLLTAVLVLLSLRLPGLRPFPLPWLLAVNLGLSAWTLAVWWPGKWRSPVAALLWVAVFGIVPELMFLVLAGIPRMGKMQGEQAPWYFWSMLILFVGAFALHFFQGAFDGSLVRMSDVQTYLALQEAFLHLFSRQALWIIIPLVGLFEIAQKQPDDLRISWRNLALAGAVFSLIWVPIELAVPLLYLLCLPLSALMLTRWCLALPDRYARSAYGLLMLALLLPFLKGGLV